MIKLYKPHNSVKYRVAVATNLAYVAWSSHMTGVLCCHMLPSGAVLSSQGEEKQASPNKNGFLTWQACPFYPALNFSIKIAAYVHRDSLATRGRHSQTYKRVWKDVTEIYDETLRQFRLISCEIELMYSGKADLFTWKSSEVFLSSQTWWWRQPVSFSRCWSLNAPQTPQRPPMK